MIKVSDDVSKLMGKSFQDLNLGAPFLFHVTLVSTKGLVFFLPVQVQLDLKSIIIILDGLANTRLDRAEMVPLDGSDPGQSLEVESFGVSELFNEGPHPIKTL